MQNQPAGGGPWFAADDVTLLVGDDEEPSGQAVRDAMDDVDALVAALAPATNRTMIYQAGISDTEANAAVLANMNFNKPYLIAMLATTSKPYRPADFFIRGFPGSQPYWNTSDVVPGWFVSAILAASCEAALWQPLGQSLDQSVYMDFLTTLDRGTVAWIGPANGSYHTGNAAVLKNLVEELLTHPTRAMGESWLAAMVTAYETLSPALRPTLDSFAFFGSPLSRLLDPPAYSIEAFTRKEGSLFMLSNDENVAIGCPAGDIDQLVVKIEVERQGIGDNLSASDVIISQPDSPTGALFSEDGEIHADAAPALGPDDVYRATVTIDAFSGCGQYSLPVSVRGVSLGYVKVRVKSPDMVLVPAETTRGKVVASDFGKFGSYYPSTTCDCVATREYSSCADFAPPDTVVGNPDFSFFGPHYDHQFTPPGGAAVTAGGSTSQGTLRVDVTEEQPLVGQHKVWARVILENMEPFSTAVIALRNENEDLHFSGWIPDPTLDGKALCAEIMRDGTRQVFIGVLAEEPSSGDLVIGTAEFLVESTEPLNVTEQDFKLVTGDILISTGVSATHAEQPQLSLVSRRLTVTHPTYRNELAQNYPNPFNPTTTISFSVAEDMNVDLRIYDVRGAAVKTLTSGRHEAGVHRMAWDGRNDRGQPVASGVFFYKLVAGSFTDTKKMTILK